MAIADIAAVAGAFVLRAAAGGVAAGVPISRWFFVVVSFSALFVAAGKRYSDFLDPAARRSRAVLREYNAEFLHMVLGIACAVALGAYCLWAFQGLGRDALGWREVTIVPFTVALLRYALLVTAGAGWRARGSAVRRPLHAVDGAGLDAHLWPGTLRCPAEQPRGHSAHGAPRRPPALIRWRSERRSANGAGAVSTTPAAVAICLRTLRSGLSWLWCC